MNMTNKIPYEEQDYYKYEHNGGDMIMPHEIFWDLYHEYEEMFYKYNKALECLSSFNFEIPCENDEFFDEHCGWCEENCSVDEEQYKKCWNKFIEWKLGDRKDG